MVSTRGRPGCSARRDLPAILIFAAWHDVRVTAEQAVPSAEPSGAPPGVLPEAGQRAPSSEAPARKAENRASADAMARAVIECAADAIVAFGTDRAVMLWNPAAERMFGWGAAEVVGFEPQIIPEELKAEHNAVLERVRGGGQISFATRRIRKDRTVIDVRIDTSALTDGAGEVTGWVNVCHQAGEDSGPALHGRTRPGRAQARRRGRRHERPARPGIGARPHRGQPAGADQRGRGRFRDHRGGHAAAGQHGRPARQAARADRDPVHQPGRRAACSRARRS